jgi:Zn-dependent peptidase ImmA (M78 family)
LRKLIERTGGKIKVVEDPSDQETDGGSLEIRGKNDYTVFLSPYTTPLRDNFTIAHELGHYVLHFFFASAQPQTPIRFARYGSSPIEWQANRFAAAILMPADKFRDAYQKFNGNLSLLSGLFGVSLPAVEVRARSLGLIEE